MHLHEKENSMKTRCVPVLVVLVAAVFASSDLAGEIIVLDMPGANDTFAHDIDGNNVVGWFYSDPGSSKRDFLYNGTDYTTLNVPGAAYPWCRGRG